MVSIKQFFSEHAMLYNAKVKKVEKPNAEKPNAEKSDAKKMYHVDVAVPESIEYMPKPGKFQAKLDACNKVSVFKIFKSSPWAAKTKAAVQPAPPAGETKYTLDHEMDALNLWSPWAAKTKAAKGMAPLTERELENIKNKSWTVERRA
jgi:hypothetical protein